MSGTPIKVKGLGSNKQKPQNRNFEKHLKGNKEKKDSKAQMTDRDLNAREQSQKTVSDSGNSDNRRLNDKQRQIDVLV